MHNNMNNENISIALKTSIGATKSIKNGMVLNMKVQFIRITISTCSIFVKILFIHYIFYPANNFT